MPAQAFDGTYALNGNVIELKRNGGGELIAQLDPGKTTGFNLKMRGVPDDDPGLNFVR